MDEVNENLVSPEELDAEAVGEKGKDCDAHPSCAAEPHEPLTEFMMILCEPGTEDEDGGEVEGGKEALEAGVRLWSDKQEGC